MPVSVAVLDNFNRADGGLGANWATDPYGDGGGAPSIASNQFQASFYDNARYTPTTVSSASGALEVAATVNVLTTTNGQIYVGLVQQPGVGTADGYMLQITVRSGNDDWELYRWTNGVTASIAVLNGNAAGDLTIGDKIILRRSAAGAWTCVKDRAGTETTVLGPTADTTFTGTFEGTLGAFDSTSAVRLDDFALGVVVAGGTNALAGTIASSSVLTGALTVTAPLAGTSAAASTLAGALTARAGLAGTIAGSSTVTGAATVTAGLAGTITATSSLTGALTNTSPGGVPLAGTIAASSTLAGALTVAAPLAGTVAAASTVTGTLTVSAAGTNPLAGTIAGTSTITGALLVTKPLAGAVTATSTVTGLLTVSGGLAGTVAASSTLTGALTVRHPLAGSIDGSSTLTGAITVLRLLSGQITAVSALTGTLTNQGPVTAVGRLEGGLSAVFGESTAASSVSESTSGVLALTE